LIVTASYRYKSVQDIYANDASELWPAATDNNVLQIFISDILACPRGCSRRIVLAWFIEPVLCRFRGIMCFMKSILFTNAERAGATSRARPRSQGTPATNRSEIKNW